MKSYLFATEDDRGGVILCDIDEFEEAVEYLQQRFNGVVRVEQGRTLWTKEEGFGIFEPSQEIHIPGITSEPESTSS